MMSDLSLEKLKISERLTSLEKSVEMFIAENSKDHTDIKVLLGKYGDNIFGNGKPGLNVRTDRLETIAENRKWVLIVIGGTLLGLVLQRFWSIFLHG